MFSYLRVLHRVDILFRCHQGRKALFAEDRVLSTHEIRDVLNRDDPTAAVRAEHVAPEAKLDRAPRELLTVRVVIGVPLQADVGRAKALLPGGLVFVEGRHACRGHGLTQNLVEPFPADAHRQDDFLVLLRCPTATVHHP